jgi:hypothetical protein
MLCSKRMRRVRAARSDFIAGRNAPEYGVPRKLGASQRLAGAL